MTLADAVLILGLIFALLAVHPFTTYPASLWLAVRLRRAGAGGAATDDDPAWERRPRVAVCCCAYNEIAAIDDKLRSLTALADAWPGLQVHVYDDGSTDGTRERLAAAAGGIDVVLGAGRAGKTHGMNRLVARAGPVDVLVFTDANVIFDSAALAELVRPFADETVGCVSGHLVYVNEYETGTAVTGGLYWRFEEALKTLEARLGSATVADGSLFALRRRLHRPVPEDLIDDMFLSLAVFAGGGRILQAADAIAFERTATRAGEEFRRKVRIACQAINVHRTLRPALRRMSWRRRYVYVSHKLLRWVCVYHAALAVALIGGWAAMAVGPALPLAAGALALSLALAAARWMPQRFETAIAVASALVAVGIGVARALGGERFRTWEQAASTR